jgi:PAS domain S-box-containing protein
MLIVAGGLTAVLALRVTAEDTRQLAEERLVRMQDAQNMVEHTLLIERESFQILSAQSLDKLRESYAATIKHVESWDLLVDRLSQAGSDLSILSLHQSGQLFRNTLNIVVKLGEELLRKGATEGNRAGQLKMLENYHRQLQNQAVAMVEAARELSANFTSDYRLAMRQLAATSLQNQKRVLALLAGSLVLAWLVTRYFLGRHVVARLQQVSDFLRLSAADQTTQIPVQGSDEIAEMARAVEQFLENRRKLAQTQGSLRESEEMLRTVIDAAPTAIFGLDLDGRVQAVWNHAAETMLGWNASEIMGRPLPSVQAGNQNEFSQFLQRIRQGFNLDGLEVTRHRRDGSPIDFCLYASPLHDAEGKISGNIAVLVDITARKQLENEVRQRNLDLETSNSKLEAAYRDLQDAQAHLLQQEKMASIGQLAAGVAHEINNPMGFIISNLSTLEKYLARLLEFQQLQESTLTRLVESQPAEADAVKTEIAQERKRLKIDAVTADIGELIEESLEGGERVKKIVQNLKGFARLDEEEWKPADLNQGLESTLNMVWNEVKYKATVSREFGDIPKIMCNAGQLNQVFMNLLLNAAQAIEGQGEIRLKTRVEDDCILVEIADSGAGIPAANLSRIFEPFFTTKDVGKGTGLGLAIAYDIVKKHQGEIRVDSEPGKGTTFTLRLPLQPQVEDAVPA